MPAPPGAAAARGRDQAYVGQVLSYAAGTGPGPIRSPPICALFPGIPAYDDCAVSTDSAVKYERPGNGRVNFPSDKNGRLYLGVGVTAVRLSHRRSHGRRRSYFSRPK